MPDNKEIKKVTTNTLQKMKTAGEKISMLTAYDFSFAKIFDAAGIDIILVGDSASNVIAGHETTLPITLDQMIYHATSVVKAVERALVVVDIPFGYYQGSSGEALRSSIRIMKESGAHAVKLEGGSEVKDSVLRILSAGTDHRTQRRRGDVRGSTREVRDLEILLQVDAERVERHFRRRGTEPSFSRSSTGSGGPSRRSGASCSTGRAPASPRSRPRCSRSRVGSAPSRSARV